MKLRFSLSIATRSATRSTRTACGSWTLASRSSADPHLTWLDYCKRIPELFTELCHCIDHSDWFGLAHTVVKLHENDTG